MTARGVVRDVETSRVRLDGGTQVRIDLYVDDVVQSYADAIEAGETLPPIDVVDDGTHLWLVDGFHRHAAHLRLRRAVISARVVPGTREDAQWWAASANATHGLRRTSADKRSAVRLALTHPRAATLSIAQVAKHCRVSRQLADEVARELARERAEAEPERRLGADGKWYPTRRQQDAELHPGDLTPRNHTIGDRRSDADDASRATTRTHSRASIDTSTADAPHEDDAWIPDDEARVQDGDDAGIDAPASAEKTRGEIAIEVLAPRVAGLRDSLAALARDASALRAAITRAERDAPESVVPAQLSSRWPLGDALAAVGLALDELDPAGLCAACAGAGCARCAQTGWTSTAAQKADRRREKAVAAAGARRRGG